MGCGVSKTQPVLAPVAADTASEEKPEVDTEKAAEVEPKQEAGAGESIEEKEAWLTDWMENEQDDDGSREAAALKIQALQRGRKGRDEVSELRARCPSVELFGWTTLFLLYACQFRCLYARLAEMEQRAEVYRGVVRAAEASYEKVQEKVAEDLRRLDEDRCEWDRVGISCLCLVYTSLTRWSLEDVARSTPSMKGRWRTMRES